MSKRAGRQDLSLEFLATDPLVMRYIFMLLLLQQMSLPRVTVSDFSAVTDGSITVPGDADANTPYVTLDDVAIYKHDLVITYISIRSLV